MKASSGRQRLNVLAALNATTQEIFTVQNLTSVTAETVCELLRLLAGAHPGMAITLVLDNARYHKCALVQEQVQSLGIELLYLPAYSPNLNLIERFWKGGQEELPLLEVLRHERRLSEGDPGVYRASAQPALS